MCAPWELSCSGCILTFDLCLCETILMQAIMQSIKAYLWFSLSMGTCCCITGIPSGSSLQISLHIRHCSCSDHKLKVSWANEEGDCGSMEIYSDTTIMECILSIFLRGKSVNRPVFHCSKYTCNSQYVYGKNLLV